MSTAPTLSLEQLIALNDEIAALARAGVPLEQGLTFLGRDEPSQLGRFAEQLSERMQRGESLAQLVGSDKSGLPPLYRAVVAAGLRGGNLAQALQALATTARRTLELRRLARGALAYPLLVLLVAYALFVFSLINIVPALISSYATWELPPGPLVSLLANLQATVGYWWYVPPLLLLAYVAWELWIASRWDTRASLGWCSPIARLQRARRLATFAETLALLVAHRVPLGEGVELAAGAAGDPALQNAARNFAAQLARGETLTAPGFPPLLGLLLANSKQPAELERALRRAADDYEAKARRAIDWLTLYLPAILTVVVGGGAVLLQTISFFGPWLQLLKHIGLP